MNTINWTPELKSEFAKTYLQAVNTYLRTNFAQAIYFNGEHFDFIANVHENSLGDREYVVETITDYTIGDNWPMDSDGQIVIDDSVIRDMVWCMDCSGWSTFDRINEALEEAEQ